MATTAIEKRNLYEVLKEKFETAKAQHIKLEVIFKYDLSSEVFATDHGLKVELLGDMRRCAVSTEILHKVKRSIEKERIAQVIYHRATDTDIAVDREEILIFHNF